MKNKWNSYFRKEELILWGDDYLPRYDDADGSCGVGVLDKESV